MRYLLTNPLLRKIMFIIDAVGYLFHKHKRPPSFEDIKSIIIFRFDELGDMLTSTPLFYVMKLMYPKAKITVICRKEVASILKGNKDVDKIILWERPPWFGFDMKINFWQSLKYLWNHKLPEHYDIGIEMHTNPLNILLLRRQNVKFRIAYGFRGLGFLADWNPEFNHEDHIIKRNMKLSGCFCLGRTPMFIKTKKCKIPQKPYIVAHLHTTREVKKWDINNWISLLNKLGGRYKVVCCGKYGTDYTKTIQEYAYLIEHAKFVVSVDTVASHISEAVGTPCLTLFGAEQPGPKVWGYTNYIKKDNMDDITVEEVYGRCGGFKSS
jgi:ADP-heptose:LPS heptosyltransferase